MKDAYNNPVDLRQLVWQTRIERDILDMVCVEAAIVPQHVFESSSHTACLTPYDPITSFVTAFPLLPFLPDTAF